MYENKYLKYKDKYLTLKNGGSLKITNNPQLYFKKGLLQEAQKGLLQEAQKENDEFDFLKNIKEITDYEIKNHIHRLESFFLKDINLIVRDIEINNQFNQDKIIFHDNKNNFSLSIDDQKYILKETRFYLNNYNAKSINKKTVDLNNEYSIILTLYVEQKPEKFELIGGVPKLLCESNTLSDIYKHSVRRITTPESVNLFRFIFIIIAKLLLKKILQDLPSDKLSGDTLFDKMIYFYSDILNPLFTNLYKIFTNLDKMFIFNTNGMSRVVKILNILYKSINESNNTIFNLYNVETIIDKMLLGILPIEDKNNNFNFRLIMNDELNTGQLLILIDKNEFMKELHDYSMRISSEYHAIISSITFEELCQSSYHQKLELYHLKLEENKCVHNGIYQETDINALLNIFSKTVNFHNIKNELQFIHGYLHNYDKMISTNDPRKENVNFYTNIIAGFSNMFYLHCFELIANKNRYHMLQKNRSNMFIIDKNTGKYAVNYKPEELERKVSQNSEVVDFDRHNTIQYETMLLPNNDYITIAINKLIKLNSELVKTVERLIYSMEESETNKLNVNTISNIINKIRRDENKYRIFIGYDDEQIINLILLCLKYIINKENYYILS